MTQLEDKLKILRREIGQLSICSAAGVPPIPRGGCSEVAHAEPSVSREHLDHRRRLGKHIGQFGSLLPY